MLCPQKPFWQVVLEADAEEQGITPQESLKKMQTVWQVMKSAIESYDPNMVSASGFVGREGGIMDAYVNNGDSLCGPFVSRVISRALMMGCSNACMRRIVAAPTAGACGVLPLFSTPIGKAGPAVKRKSSTRCMSPQVWGRSSQTAPALQVPRADVRRKLAPHRAWPPLLW